MKPQRTKELLLEFCADFVSQRRKQVESDISRIEESLLQEGKSTAGDKHHTARAMLQLDRENAGKQLMQIEKLEEVLGKIDILRSPSPIALGSCVETTKGHYFIGISAGVHTIDGEKYFCVSPGTPIGKLLLGKTKGDVVVFNNNSMQIEAVY